MHEDRRAIMLVDDHPIFLDAIGAAMSRKFPDSDVRLMSNISETRNALHCGVIPALAVTDVHLPDGDGVELVGEMHGHYGRRRIIDSSRSCFASKEEFLGNANCPKRRIFVQLSISRSPFVREAFHAQCV